MKSIRLIPLVATALICITGCDKSTQRETELERKASEAIAHQQELQQQLEDQRLAAERDAIEREKLQIEEARAALEQQQQENATAEAEALRQREEELAHREGRLQQSEITLQEQVTNVGKRNVELSERDRSLAGREALAADEPNGYSGGPVADYGMFYDSLSSYGSWLETPDYGYVWQPVIVREVSWRPYTRGRWVCSDYGWTWLSDEPFGWATYHYGRWALLRGYGWVWVPGTEWAPSWVSWRSSGSCIGWAPLPPETLAWRSHNWGNTVDVTFSIGALWFSFVEYRHFSEPIYRHCLPYQQNNDYYHQTVNITNIHVHNHRIVSGGPSYDDIRRRGGKTLPFYRLDMDRHGRPGRDSLAMRPRIEDGRLRIAAPDVNAEWNEGLKPSKIKRRLENITVERSDALKPEIIENFRKSREKDRFKAEKIVAEHGGRESFNQRRLETLEANRRQLPAQIRDAEKAAASKDQDKQPQPQRETSRPQPAPDEARNRLRKPENQQPEVPPRDAAQPSQLEQQQVEQSRRDQAQQRALTVKPQVEKNRGRLELPTNPQTEAPRPESDNNARQQQQLEQARRNQELQQQRELSEKKRLEKTLRLQLPSKPQPETPRSGADDSVRQQQQQQQQLEQARHDQEQQLEQQREQTRQRQQEEARQQQLDQLRHHQEQQLEQSRQQKLEETRQKEMDEARNQQQQQLQQQQLQQQQLQQQQLQQQREQSRLQQMEEARQQQLEQARQNQELQRQQQIENARRQQEQARLQQMEDARRQQEQARQQQMEDARRDQQRQQQQQLQRQQEQQQQQSRESQLKESLKEKFEKRHRDR